VSVAEAVDKVALRRRGKGQWKTPASTAVAKFVDGDIKARSARTVRRVMKGMDVFSRCACAQRHILEPRDRNTESQGSQKTPLK
jgi:hypothetical protein